MYIYMHLPVYVGVCLLTKRITGHLEDSVVNKQRLLQRRNSHFFYLAICREDLISGTNCDWTADKQPIKQACLSFNMQIKVILQ